MERSLRPSGIPLLGDIPWGSHFCQFYRTQHDLLELLVPYFKAGLENNEYCLWVTAEQLSCAQAEAALRAKVRDFDTRLACGQILIVSAHEWYRTERAFDPRGVFNTWTARNAEALARGYEGLRVSGDASWVKRESWRDFAAYEKEADAVVSAGNVIGLCTYPIETCGANETLDVMQNHAFALVRRDGAWEVIENQARRRALLAARDFRQKYETLFAKMPGGFAYHQVICNDRGEPIDFLYIETNEAFERLTGLKRDAVIGRRATEVIPGIQGELAERIHRYGRVALTGEPARFEEYSAALGRRLSVSAYSPERGYVAVILQEAGGT